MTRDEHKAEFKSQLMQIDRVRILEIREQNVRTVEHNRACWVRQNENGMNIPEERLHKNNARKLLEIECIDEVLKDADTNLQKMAFAADHR